jgi:hypothetical protein
VAGLAGAAVRCGDVMGDVHDGDTFAYSILLPITIPPPATPAVTSIGQRQRPGMIHPCALSAGRDYGRTQYHHIER